MPLWEVERIFDAVRTINNVIDFTKLQGYNGMLTAIDFIKVFNSLNWNSLFQSLASFGFGVYCLDLDLV